MIGVKPVAELAYPCGDLHDVSTRVKRDEYANLGTPYQTGWILYGYGRVRYEEETNERVWCIN
jgi:hypothetical protein